jgi:HNH endonuclease
LFGSFQPPFSRNPLLARTLQTFRATFGNPNSRTTKVFRWHLRPDMGVVVQIDYPGNRGAYIWVPYPPGADLPDLARISVYPANKGRHHHLHHRDAPGLGERKRAARLLVMSEAEVERGVRHIKLLLQTRCAPVARDLEEPSPASRKKSVVLRIVRDSTLVHRLRSLHRNRCQMCGTAVKLRPGEDYSEGHHLKPLGAHHHGPDVAENVVIACPNHHAMLDLGDLNLRRRSCAWRRISTSGRST